MRSFPASTAIACSPATADASIASLTPFSASASCCFASATSSSAALRIFSLFALAATFLCYASFVSRFFIAALTFARASPTRLDASGPFDLASFSATLR